MKPIPSELIKKIIVIFCLGCLIVSAFFIRLTNFKKSTARSIDEIVYYRMGKQIHQQGLSGYNTIPYALELAAEGRPLPKYFFQPIFKYPPLFSALIAQSLKLFDPNLLSAYYIALLAGVLMIPLTYLLGATLYNRFVGLTSALLMFTDPVGIICSQKVWMETTLALFTLSSIFFFVLALKNKKSSLFIVAGIFTGLATLTKYPGILLIGIFSLYAKLRDKNLFRDGFFLAGLFIPLAMLIPWALWNWDVYGEKTFDVQLGFHSSSTHQKDLVVKTVKLLFLIITGLSWWTLRGKKIVANILVGMPENKKRQWLYQVATFTFIFLFGQYLWRALNLTSLPSTSWSPGMFYSAPLSFYPGRILEFSLFYVFAYAAFFISSEKSNKGTDVIKISLIVMMAFYIFWGNYQSRYILACIPLLLVMAAWALQSTIKKLLEQPHSAQRIALLLALAMFITYAGVKTAIINLNLSFPNDLCYF